MHNKAIIIFFLIALNLCLCVLVFVENRQVQQTRDININLQNESESKYNALEFAYSSLLFRDNDRLLNDLRCLNLIRMLKSNELYLFIPKNPCDVCLNNELDFIMGQEIGITLLAPDYRGKSLRARFNTAKGIRVETYISDSIELEKTVAEEDNLIYFTVKDNIIIDYYPVNKYYPVVRQVYFKQVQNYYNPLMFQ